MSKKLKQSVEFQKLNAGALVNLCARHPCKDRFENPFCPRIPVTNRIFNQFSRAVDEPVVNSPAIDSNTPDGDAQRARPFTRFPRAGFYLVKDLREVPTQMPTLQFRWVIKASYLFKQQFSWRCAGQKHAPASRSEIN
jgi:hypothetical protein